jgi:outer membrane protein TolC
MKKALFMLILIFGLNLLHTAEEKPIQNLSMEEAIVKALKNNLDLQIEMTNPEIARQMVDKSAAIFVPVFGANFNHNQRNSPSSTQLDGGLLVSSGNSTLSFNLSQQIALGGTVSIRLDNTRSSTTSRFSTFNPYYNSTFSLTLNQPLLKGFGTSVTKMNIYVAQNNQQKSILALKQQIIDLIYSVEDAYWSLVYAYQNLDVINKSLDLARELLKQNEIQVKVGVSAPLDILTAKAEVASRESDQIQAENQVRLYEENLRKILNITDLKGTLKPVDTPVFATIAADFDKFLLTALEKRPDIGQVRMELKSKNIEVKYYRNQLLPDLQVSASYYTSGLAGDRLIFEGDPLFGGTVIGVIKSDVWASMKDVLSNVYRNYSFGLQLSVPLKNDSARADLIQAQLALKQTLLQLKQTESTIYSDVKQIVMDIEYGLKLVDATRISRELAEQKLISEQKKMAVGLSYNYLVLQFQRDLANARIAELKAMIDYNLSMARINKVLGETFEKHRIEFSDFLQKR